MPSCGAASASPQRSAIRPAKVAAIFTLTNCPSTARAACSKLFTQPGRRSPGASAASEPSASLMRSGAASKSNSKRTRRSTSVVTKLSAGAISTLTRLRASSGCTLSQPQYSVPPWLTGDRTQIAAALDPLYALHGARLQEVQHAIPVIGRPIARWNTRPLAAARSPRAPPMRSADGIRR